MKKKKILDKFSIGKKQELKFSQYINCLKAYNSHTNIVGRSTLINPWVNHILDSLQILRFIENKKLSILDMGTGAGLPGIILSIAGYENVTLIDSNGKKIKFLKIIKKKLNLKSKIILSRIEKLNNQKFDIITSRALSKLENLLSYSQKFIKKNTLLVFLKGKTVNEEILQAKKKWKFEYVLYQSISDPRGNVLILKNIREND